MVLPLNKVGLSGVRVERRTKDTLTTPVGRVVCATS